MTPCLFVSDLHGRTGRYRKLFDAVSAERPKAVFFGGDIGLYFDGRGGPEDFINRFFLSGLERLRETLGAAYPRMFVILGNQDPRSVEPLLVEASNTGLLSYMHTRKEPFASWTVYGYAFVPPSPFRLKDWERYDVTRSLDPGCLPPEEGLRTVDFDRAETRSATIARDLEALVGTEGAETAVVLFHAPPRDTNLDRLETETLAYDRRPRAAHAGSVAIRRFIETAQPLLTMHGHIHESARITGSWRDRIGRTVILSAAHDGPELALVRFDLEDPSGASRELL